MAPSNDPEPVSWWRDTKPPTPGEPDAWWVGNPPPAGDQADHRSARRGSHGAPAGTPEPDEPSGVVITAPRPAAKRPSPPPTAPARITTPSPPDTGPVPASLREALQTANQPALDPARVAGAVDPSAQMPPPAPPPGKPVSEPVKLSFQGIPSATGPAGARVSHRDPEHPSGASHGRSTRKRVLIGVLLVIVAFAMSAAVAFVTTRVLIAGSRPDSRPPDTSVQVRDNDPTPAE